MSKRNKISNDSGLVLHAFFNSKGRKGLRKGHKEKQESKGLKESKEKKESKELTQRDTDSFVASSSGLHRGPQSWRHPPPLGGQGGVLWGRGVS
jgi:hypothetical protein